MSYEARLNLGLLAILAVAFVGFLALGHALDYRISIDPVP